MSFQHHAHGQLPRTPEAIQHTCSLTKASHERAMNHLAARRQQSHDASTSNVGTGPCGCSHCCLTISALPARAVYVQKPRRSRQGA